MNESIERMETRAPSVGDAVGRVVSAGQRLIVDRIDLAVAQVSEVKEQITEVVTLMLVGVAALIVAWCALNYAFVIVVGAALSWPAALLIAAGVNVAVGVVFVKMGLKKRLLAHAGNGES
jgi:uncharacterized membrane protein YqjE